jgi:mannose-6-phosphate isomerase-like protein (cupin superfamily)
MTLTTATDAARHETPNAVMRTLAAPSTGTAELSVWEVRMRAGQRGPVHTADREQVWLVLTGRLQARVGTARSVADGADTLVRADEEDMLVVADAGDTLVVAAGAERRIEAEADLTAIVSSLAGPVVTTPDSPGGRPLPWAT